MRRLDGLVRPKRNENGFQSGNWERRIGGAYALSVLVRDVDGMGIENLRNTRNIKPSGLGRP